MAKRTPAQSGRYKKRKGKRGELEAAKFLRSLGFDVHRSAQYQGGKSSHDLCGPDGAPLPVNIEVKNSPAVRLGTKMLDKACEQAKKDAGDRLWVVLWKERGGWRLTGDQISLIDDRAYRATWYRRDDIQRWVIRLGMAVVP